jgi:hypothetical protein
VLHVVLLPLVEDVLLCDPLVEPPDDDVPAPEEDDVEVGAPLELLDDPLELQAVAKRRAPRNATRNATRRPTRRCMTRHATMSRGY